MKNDSFISSFCKKIRQYHLLLAHLYYINLLNEEEIRHIEKWKTKGPIEINLRQAENSI